MPPILIRRMPHLDETGWSAWWLKDEAGEAIEWRYGKSLRVSTSTGGVMVSGDAFFADEDARQTFSVIVRLAQHGVDIMRRRDERSRDGRSDRRAAPSVERDEEPESRSVDMLTWYQTSREIH